MPKKPAAKRPTTAPAARSAAPRQISPPSSVYNQEHWATGVVFWDWDIVADHGCVSRPSSGPADSLGADFFPDFRHLEKTIRPEDLPNFRSRLDAHLAGKSPLFAADYHIQLQGSGWRQISTRGRVVARAENGDPLRMVGVTIDETERLIQEERHKALEAKLHQAQKMEAIGTLAGGIAHDFNNILSVINGFTELVLESPTLDAECSKNLQHVLKAGRRAKDLVNRILAFGQKSEPEFIPVRVQEIINEAYHFLRQTIPANIGIQLSLDPAAPRVLGDPTQLQQLLINLGTNAFHSMALNDKPDNVLHIALKTEFFRKRVPGFPELLPGTYVSMAVSDTGAGMDTDVLSRIFEPYFTTKEAGFGTGLGLAIVHGIVKSHHGAIRVTSLPGEGSTFQILLPVLVGEISACPEVKQEEIRAFSGKERILVVDDEPFVTRLCRQILSGFGYRVTTCNSGMEALDRLEQNPERYDAVLTDLTMPRISGLDLAERVRSIRPKLPVIICTGFNAASLNPRASRLGIQHVLQKPFSVVDLARVIRTALDDPPIPAAEQAAR